MKTTGILLIACFALFMRDANCVGNALENFEDLPANINDYELLGILGVGNYSEVKKAKVNETGKIVAIKIMDKNKLTPGQQYLVRNEAKIMKMIEHPNIIKLLKDFEDRKEKKRYLVMEYASKGNVKQYLKENGAMNETKARDIFKQLFDAVEYLHGKNIVHGDLKPENFLINEEGVIKLADFGFAADFTPGANLYTFVGTPEYMSPEIRQRIPYNGPMAEVWSLGVILYELLTGKLAFDPEGNLSFDDVKNNIVRGTFSDPPGVSSECSAFIRRFIVKEPKQRCTLKGVKEEETNWLKAKSIH